MGVREEAITERKRSERRRLGCDGFGEGQRDGKGQRDGENREEERWLNRVGGFKLPAELGLIRTGPNPT